MLSRRQKDILQQLERADDFISIRTLCFTIYSESRAFRYEKANPIQN